MHRDSEIRFLEFYVHGIKIDVSKCESLKSCPKNISAVKAVRSLVGVVDSLNVCPGHPNSEFVGMVKKIKGKIVSPCTGCIVARLDDYAFVVVDGTAHATTIRPESCMILTTGSTARCSSCALFFL